MAGKEKKENSKPKMLTPRQYAEKHNFKYTTVMDWLQNGLLEGAVKIALPEGHVYQVPENAKKPERRRGPVPGSKKPANKSARKGSR